MLVSPIDRGFEIFLSPKALSHVWPFASWLNLKLNSSPSFLTLRRSQDNTVSVVVHEISSEILFSILLEVESRWL